MNVQLQVNLHFRQVSRGVIRGCSPFQHAQGSPAEPDFMQGRVEETRFSHSSVLEITGLPAHYTNGGKWNLFHSQALFF